MECGITVTDLGKRYGDRDALSGVTLEVPRGECCGFLGSNGAGKTTLVKILATLIRPTSGSAQILGHDVVRGAAAARRSTSLLLDVGFMPRDFTLAEGLEYHAALHGLAADATARRRMAERVGLAWRLRDPLRTFSRGMGQRASLACALLKDAELLLLDEPFAGLDRAGCALVEEAIDDYRGAGRMVLLVTHDLERAARLCDRVFFFQQGRVSAARARGAWSERDFDGGGA